MVPLNRQSGLRCGKEWGTREQHEGEQWRFQAGISTIVLVLQRQSAMNQAQSREVRAGSYREEGTLSK